MKSNKTHINYYLETPLVKMGKWSCLPADSDTWHNQEVNKYHLKTFGIQKGLLTIHTLEDGYQHMYATKNYMLEIGNYIDSLTKKNVLALSKILNRYYLLVKAAKQKVSGINTKQVHKFTKAELIKYFILCRDWIHRITVFDQFAWLAEEHLTQRAENVLIQELGINKNSLEFKELFFKLTKPEKLSTTLLEKLAVLQYALNVKHNKLSITLAAKRLSKKYGWLPIFVFGESWDSSHYLEELKLLKRQKKEILEKEIRNLKNYKNIRAKEILEIKRKYKITLDQLQKFIDFGLAIDTRNEAEYFVSYAGQFLMPLYKRFAREFSISLKQLRFLTEKEIISCIKQPSLVQKLLDSKRKYVGWGFTPDLKKQVFFSESDSEKLFNFVEKHTPYIQGNNENVGVCASPGKVQGIARIVPNPQHNHKVKMGDILITYTTTTDYLPAMKRAKAIITEVGGMTCHAAVVSREFNIPCIVSLKNAMKNIPDGCKIEVDATNGTIKVFKK